MKRLRKPAGTVWQGEADEAHDDEIAAHDEDVAEAGRDVVVGIALDEPGVNRAHGEMEDVVYQEQQDQRAAPADGAGGGSGHLRLKLPRVAHRARLLPPAG